MANLPWYAYVMLGVMAISWLLTRPGLRQFIKALTRKAYAKNPKGTTLNKEQLKALSVGLINGEQILSYVDTLKTGISRERLATQLDDYWDVTDSISAKETLQWIQRSGHRATFDIILPFVLQYPDQAVCTQKIQEEYPEEEQFIEFANNLVQCMDQLKDDVNFLYTKENMKRGILAWDAGRLVTVARTSFDQGYISEDEAWEYINSAYQLVKENYTDWKHVAKSYVIGRGMWSGYTMTYDGIASIADRAVTLPESPWVKEPLK